ncbi:uncharacterized protein EV422DRAFT_212674 [Fimicolochytrium jonesii]|uniref:uncharacterized protein n=1 Tax=Fimicolochytrium jonesii TaxID=1396493 RepID=UPI0022FEB7FA|nr:uncharacterized protein EV422DRAFT_212674 [Fimicolochytrium jonesii]KAI8817696.1 hypothetical protein EV422DRAFT_212674 [Fimicolochytrium jonesii]
MISKDYRHETRNLSNVSLTEQRRQNGKSTVLKYEVRLKELFQQHPKVPSERRTAECFAIFDEIIQGLGPYGTILRTIKEELVEAIYSNDFTSAEQLPALQRLPYFCAINRVVRDRTDDESKTNEAATDLLQKLKFKEYDSQMLQRKNLALKQEIGQGELARRKLLDEIDRLNKEIKKHQDDKVDLRASHINAEDNLKRRIEGLEASLGNANGIIEKLTVFKSSYDKPVEEDKLEEHINSTTQQLVIDPLGMVEYDIWQARRLQEQFADILNWQLDDYELALTQLRKKQEILAGITTGVEERDQSYRLELNEIVAGFRKRVADLLEEQHVLGKHIQGLRTMLQSYGGDNDMNLVQRTADDALRKFAFALQFSEDKGNTFTPCKTMQYCSKCSDRTIVCPHKTLHSKDIKLPPHVTHIRFTHPQFRLRTTFSREAFEADLSSALWEEAVVLTEDELEETSAIFKKIWKQFYERFPGPRPAATRVMTEPKLQGLMLDLSELKWNAEEEFDESGALSEQRLAKFSDFVFDVMSDRYQIKDIARKAIHDFLTSLQNLETSSSAVAIFVRHLAGEEDVMWKYIHIARKFFATFELMDAPTYRRVVQVLYPSRPKEIYDQMELELVAFSKNKFTFETIWEHLLHMLRAGIEPNQKFYRLVFKQSDHQNQGTLSYDSFDEALGQVLPGAPGKLKKERYMFAERDCGKDAVTLDRLAMIASFISLYACYQNGWTPQAIMSEDLINLAYHATPGDGDRANTADTGVNEPAETTEQMQGEIDDVLNNTVAHQEVDLRAVEEEAARMAKRIGFMQKLDRDQDDDDDDEDFTQLQIMRSTYR